MNVKNRITNVQSLIEPRRKVLFIPKWYPDRKKDQNGNFVQEHAKAISAYADVVVLYANADDFSGPGLVHFDFQKDAGIPTLYFYYRKRITGIFWLDKFLKLILYFSCMFRGFRMVKRQFFRPDLLHVHVLLRTGLFAWYKRFSEGLPYLITEHWTIYLPEDPATVGPIRKWFSGFVIKRAEAMHTVSENLKRAMQNLGFRNRNFIVLPNVVNTEVFHLPETPNAINSKVQLLHISAFHERAKNISGMLRTVQKLAQMRSGFELRIVGFGPEEKQLKKLAKELGILNKTVWFEGKKESAEVARYLQQADVFLMFSNTENLPCVLIEALASGVPVITTNVGGIPEMITKEQGILLNPKDENALLQAMEFMLDHYQEFPKQKLRDYAINRFSYHAGGKQFAALYETVLQQAKNPDYVR